MDFQIYSGTGTADAVDSFLDLGRHRLMSHLKFDTTQNLLWLNHRVSGTIMLPNTANDSEYSHQYDHSGHIYPCYLLLWHSTVRCDHQIFHVNCRAIFYFIFGPIKKHIKISRVKPHAYNLKAYLPSRLATLLPETFSRRGTVRHVRKNQ